MSSPPPRVSVVIPVFNRADCIGATLESALAQEYTDLEVIVVDDGSTDGVASLVSARFPSVRLVRLERNSGIAAARNRGVAAARGELIAFLDSDDLWSPDKLVLQVADLDLHPETCLSFTDTACGRTGLGDLYSDVFWFRPERSLEQMLEGAPIATASAVLVRRRALEEVGGFDERFAVGEDQDLYLRLAARGPMRFLPLPLLRRIIRADSRWHSGRGWEDALERLLEGFLERPEGRCFRRRRRALRAWLRFRCGVLHADAGRWRAALRAIAQAFGSDPVVAVRRRGAAALSLKLAGVALGAVPAAAPAGDRQREGIRRRIRDAILRWSGQARRRSEGTAAPPPFRPPPDAPGMEASPGPSVSRSVPRGKPDLQTGN